MQRIIRGREIARTRKVDEGVWVYYKKDGKGLSSELFSSEDYKKLVGMKESPKVSRK